MTDTLTKPKLKSIRDIKADIKEHLAHYNNPKDFKTSEWKAAGRKLTYLNNCIHYLERGATGEFVESEKKRLEMLIEKIESFENYDLWKDANRSTVENSKNPQGTYKSEMGLSNLKLQLRTLRYLLK